MTKNDWCDREEEREVDPWLEAGVSLGRGGAAYSVIVAFICGVLTVALGVWMVARWVF